jgi:hypothetical protein
VKSDTLWHYTNSEGFYGIITSHKLRLADARFLNDRTERTYGIGVLLAALDLVLKAQPDGLLSQVRSEIEAPPTTNLFVCSFSERNNSMSQWERYAERGVGYCLGFSKSKLADVLKDIPIDLKQIVYARTRQRAMTAKLLQQLQRELKAAARKKVAGKTSVTATVAAVLLEALALEFKNPAFRHEREWRLISEIRRRRILLPSSHRVAFSRRGELIKPHLEIKLAPSSTNAVTLLPLVSVVCGPKLDRDVATASASYFLRQQGYNVPVSHSELSTIWR